jgi:hypothetical protein
MDRMLYFFNPEHDLALANNDRNFNAPQQAKQLARDLACLPLWYAPNESTILTNSQKGNWASKIQLLFPQIAESKLTSVPDFSQITILSPWGWDTAVCKQLMLYGASSDLLPTDLQLHTIRKLSHRNIAIKALQFIRANSLSSAQLPQPAQELTTMEDVKRFALTYPQVIFKAPWSGSGKGLCWSRDKMTDSRRGWCRNVIDKQGSVIAEPIYDKRQDFALEFACRDGEVSFAGYSLFETEKGIYRSNFLLNNEAIIEKLTEDGIDSAQLLSVQQILQTFISSEIAPDYSGMLGIDMFTYIENGQIRLHPCVEINLRMTMGCVARIFYDRFVAPGKYGRFYIDHYPTPGALWADHLQRETSLPLKLNEDRITEGYLSLTEINPSSRYRVRIEIE